MAAHVQTRVTPEEDLAAGRAAEIKSEYYGGYVYAMSGPSLLRPSTEGCDRGFRSSPCRQIESLCEYALLSQNEPRLELHRRIDGKWLIVDAAGLDGSMRFDSLYCEISLADVYQNVASEDSAPR